VPKSVCTGAVLRIVIAGLAASAGCSNTVTVKYQHNLSFGSGEGKNHETIDAGPGRYFALFYIVCISNDASGAQNFGFMPSKLSTTIPGTTINNELNNLYGLVSPVGMPAGMVKSHVGRVILRLDGDFGGNQPIFLTYQSASGESVSLVNDGFANLGGPMESTDVLQNGTPAYPPGASVCTDPPIQPPHGALRPPRFLGPPFGYSPQLFLFPAQDHAQDLRH
jgi:hypothetical protein